MKHGTAMIFRLFLVMNFLFAALPLMAEEHGAAIAPLTVDVWMEGKMPGPVTSEPEKDMPARGDGVQ